MQLHSIRQFSSSLRALASSLWEFSVGGFSKALPFFLFNLRAVEAIIKQQIKSKSFLIFSFDERLGRGRGEKRLNAPKPSSISESSIENSILKNKMMKFVFKLKKVFWRRNLNLSKLHCSNVLHFLWASIDV